MATTAISDIIVPQIWLPYTIRRTSELSALVTSGIVEASGEFVTLANGAGQTVNMPYWVDLAGSDEVLSDSSSLSTGKIGTAQDIAIIQLRGKGWDNNDLAGILAGSKPADAMADLVAAYWARRLQATVLSVLSGIFGSASLSGNLDAIHHTSGGVGTATDANTLNATTFIDAAQKLGDAKEQLTAIIMHSATEASLRKKDLIDFIPGSEQGQLIKTFQGHQVIIDDGMPVATVDGDLVYTTYLFGKGALALGVGTNNPTIDGAAPGSTWQLEFFRDAKAGTSGFLNRRRQIIHPRGVKWNGASMAGSSPTNTELATAANWTRVWENKQIRVVKITHNIG